MADGIATTGWGIEGLPWLDGPRRSLEQAIGARKLPHALLLTGPEGVGKRRLAQWLAARLLCREDRPPCGRCESCRQLAAGIHPDARLVTLEGDSQQIKVEQLRELVDFLALTSSYGASKVAVLDPAERMNRSSANGLLKTLEEPPGGALLLLVSSRPGLMPATLRSRCQVVRCRPPERAGLLAWLRTQGLSEGQAQEAAAAAPGGPLRCLRQFEAGLPARRGELAGPLLGARKAGADPLALAEALGSDGLEEVLDILSSWVRDGLRMTSGADPAQLENPDLEAVLARSLGRAGAQELCGLDDKIQRSRRLLGTPTNRRLQVEDLMVEWTRVLANDSS